MKIPNRGTRIKKIPKIYIYMRGKSFIRLVNSLAIMQPQSPRLTNVLEPAAKIPWSERVQVMEEGREKGGKEEVGDGGREGERREGGGGGWR